MGRALESERWCREVDSRMGYMSDVEIEGHSIGAAQNLIKICGVATSLHVAYPPAI